ncbi:unnamed protein product [Blumeria hordei]|uniref:Phosphoribosyl-AMP cyclohydrolase domain-containing protein n=1 Tax=Blumeria hordei TaxID=2867405 RepID=A0A383URP4_BLUHO|nr:unnamed protein product [Blumeria hordei]
MDNILPLPFIPAVDLNTLRSESHVGITAQQLACLGCAYITATGSNIDEIFQFIKKYQRLMICLDVREIMSIDDITSFLDAGITRAFVTASQATALKPYSERLVLIQDDRHPSDSEYSTNGILIEFPTDAAESEIKHRIVAADRVSPIYITRPESNISSYVSLGKQYSVIPIIPTSNLMVGPADIPGKISVSKYLAQCWNSDREDHLMPTIVTDSRGISLGLVYSSEESLQESLRTGTGVYQSRKRGLWYKGATSGNTQTLIQISLDCDQDCLKFVVEQNGKGFCHLPQSTCFGNLQGLSKLEQTLVARKSSAPEGSYTARLFSDEKLLRAKIMEEAEELCDAESREAIAFEAADLIYFALAKAVGAGVTLADIEQNLDSKSLKVKRRQGDAKGQWAAREGIAVSTVNTEATEQCPS